MEVKTTLNGSERKPLERKRRLVKITNKDKNKPCLCGSGLKLKKCHGIKAGLGKAF